MIQRLIAVVLIVFAALPAYAARRETEGLSPFAGNVGNAVWTLTIFVIVVVVLGKFAWGPILALLKDREEFIHKAVADAKRDLRRPKSGEGIHGQAAGGSQRDGGDIQEARRTPSGSART